MSDERAPWSLPDDNPSHESWRPEAGSRRQREGEWGSVAAQQADWAYDDSMRAGQDAYRQDVYQQPQHQGHYPADQYQLQPKMACPQDPPDGLYDWQPSCPPGQLCPQHAYQTYPGFTGYPGYQDSQGYQTALSNPLYERQPESDLFSDSQRPYPGVDDDMNVCPLGSDLCRNLDRGYPSGPLIDDDDDDHPPGSPRSK